MVGIKFLRALPKVMVAKVLYKPITCLKVYKSATFLPSRKDFDTKRLLKKIAQLKMALNKALALRLHKFWAHGLKNLFVISHRFFGYKSVLKIKMLKIILL
jgi:hypothetical protein